jgi:hypothetical protein
MISYTALKFNAYLAYSEPALLGDGDKSAVVRRDKQINTA